MSYHHTQSGTTLLASCTAIGVAGGVIAWQISGQPATLIAMLIVLAGISAVFHSLTVKVEGRELSWYFGFGFWTYRLGLDEIRSVSVARNRWQNGLGIRKAPGFTLYNVSGLDAVELKLKSGEIRRIGTDDPKGLAAALNAAMRATQA
ncbi:hypothetical protein [Bradyrhizobium sp.]|uniref:hypothetical protein n=1 Tax=Bradyrhizobium sp. TaxID=376 RepID=UPI0026215FCD|nr:hypothetical protein [Bradyrhizobium sp.]